MADQELPVTTSDSSVPGLPPDWPDRATDKVLDLVGTVRDKTSGPAIGVARNVVYGIVAAFIGLTALVLFLVMAFRIIDVYVPLGVWFTYLIFGVVFTGGGLFLWSKRPSGAAS